jgi:hypothetical protein
LTSAGSILNLQAAALAVQSADSGGLNINIREIHQGVGTAEVREIALSLWEANFPKLKEEATKEARARVDSFMADLIPRLDNALTSDNLNRFRAPEVQYSFNQVLQAVALRKEPELRKTLADLMVKRLRGDSETLTGIVYTEAIKTVPMLTVSMLNILGLKVLMKYGDFEHLKNWGDLEEFLTDKIGALLGFSGSYMDFQHVSYAGCGSIASLSFASTGFVSQLRKKCPHLFQHEISSEELARFHLPPELIARLFETHPNGGYSFRSRSLEELKTEIAPSNHPNHTKIIELYEESFGVEQEAKRVLLQRIPTSRAAVEKWDKSIIGMLDLSSVGTVIGASHVEITTGVQISLDLEQHVRESRTTESIVSLGAS